MRLFLLCLFIFQFAAGDHAVADEGVEVFVSILPQKYLVQRIGGERVKINVMLKPGHSPETYDPSPAQITRLTHARIYFLMGVPFEIKWREKFRLQNEAMRMVDTRRQCNLITNDAHVWTSPVNGKLIAAEIKDALVAEDPEAAPFYAANFQRLAAELDSLDAEILERLRDRRTDYFIVSHDAWAYYAARYGLQQLPMESRGREKGPRGIADLADLARREHLDIVFVQQQHPTGPAYTLATELGARVVLIDPLAGDYIDNLRRVTASIAKAIH